MVHADIERRGIASARVLAAMDQVPRHLFVPPDRLDSAYGDHPIPIGEGQTISQPFIVALMTEAADPGPNDRILEVGTGSGYGAAVLGRLAQEVWTIERHRGLADRARDLLNRLGVANVRVLCGDGTLGVPEAAPFDAIVVTAGGPDIPESLIEQLAEGGRLIIPVGATLDDQELIRITRRDGGFERTSLGPVRFVPLIGNQGWSAPSQPERG